MLQKFKIYLPALFILLALFGVASSVHAQQNTALLLEINGTIDPGTANYIERGIKTAHQAQAHLIILQLNTPGGLDKYMRSIIHTIEVSKIPIVIYVAPNGARASNAGTYILLASPIAAMAPGTHLGPATPMNMGDDEELMQKITQDKIAYIRSLAQRNDHNADWAESAVSTGARLTAEAALTNKVINLIADNVDTLLKNLNGATVKLGEKMITLDTTAMTVTQLTPDRYSQFLSVITDPNVAYILLLIGIYGLFFEFVRPGLIVPGVIGAIAIIIALYAFSLLPINYVGLILIALSIIVMPIKLFMPRLGALGILGLIFFIIGSILLLTMDMIGYQIAWYVIISIAIVTALFFFLILGMAMRSRQRRIKKGD